MLHTLCLVFGFVLNLSDYTHIYQTKKASKSFVHGVRNDNDYSGTSVQIPIVKILITIKLSIYLIFPPCT